MNYKLDRRLLAWWFAAVLVIICTHLTLDYLGFETQYKVMLASAITASVLMLPYFFMRKRVMEPLKELRDTAYRIIAGDLSARSAITSPNEFRELSETINAMVAKLSTAYGQLEKANAALEETVRERTAALTIEHEKLAAIFKSIPDGVIFVSITGEILEINPVMEEIWGVKAEELKGRTVAELPEGLLKDSLLPKCGDPNHHRRCWEVFDCVHKNCPAFMSEDLRCWLISGTFCHSEVQVSVKKKLEDVCSKCIVYKDVMEHCGEVIEMEIKGRQYKISSSLVLNLDQKVIGEVKTFYDVTQEKLLEKRKADFVSLITHDLKSPLTSILGYSDLLTAVGSDRMSAEENEYLGTIKANGKRLLDMVEEYLELTKLEAGMMAMEFKAAKPADFIGDAVTGVMVQAKEKGIALGVFCPDDLPPVEVDREKMIRVVTNMLSNAVKYTANGGEVSLIGRTVPGDGSADNFEMSVSDNGCGISEEDLPHIFERYYRARKTSGIRGTGLGLAVVKSLVEAHGGSVSVMSAQGKGSTFTVRIPLKRRAPDAKSDTLA